MTCEQVGERVDRTAATVRSWVRTGQLEGYRFQGREIRITEAALQAFIEGQRNGAAREDRLPQRAKPLDLATWRGSEKSRLGS